MQNNTCLPQGLLLRCSKTTTSESLIDQRVVLNEQVLAEVDRRRKPQRDNVHIEAGGVHCWNIWRMIWAKSTYRNDSRRNPAVAGFDQSSDLEL